MLPLLKFISCQLNLNEFATALSYHCICIFTITKGQIDYKSTYITCLEYIKTILIPFNSFANSTK